MARHYKSLYPICRRVNGGAEDDRSEGGWQWIAQGERSFLHHVRSGPDDHGIPLRRIREEHRLARFLGLWFEHLVKAYTFAEMFNTREEDARLICTCKGAVAAKHPAGGVKSAVG